MSKRKLAKQQAEQQEFLSGKPSRQEVMQVCNNMISNAVNSVINSVNLSLMAFEKVLTSKKVCTDKEIKSAFEEIRAQVMKEVAEKNKSQESEQECKCTGSCHCHEGEQEGECKCEKDTEPKKVHKPHKKVKVNKKEE